MDLSQYAELFLAESREHLGACNQLLLEWERKPQATEPVGGIFRAVHTVKGMAATMGYARVAELSHRMENLLDLLRRGGRKPTDALERAIDLSVAGRDREADVSGIAAELDAAAQRFAPADAKAAKAAAVAAPPPPTEPPAGGRLVQVTLRAETPLKGVRALLVLRRAESLGAVHGVTPPLASFEADDFDGRFAFRLASEAAAADIEKALRGAGDVETVAVDAVDTAAAEQRIEPGVVEAAKARHIRVDLRRLDALMDLIGELTITRGRLNEFAAQRRDVAVDEMALQVSRLSTELQSEIIQA